ncbi:hypothetical protein DFH11DRAFT_1794516 [Phellopilus nigrolimitatus]|nr:hypothetical protein DFH11DRAFT_1794516 [Phellopilus nigrolimitatus]
MYRSRASGFDTIGQMFNLAVPAARCASSRYAGSAAASSLKRRAARAIAPVMRKVIRMRRNDLVYMYRVRRAMSVRDALSTRLTLDSIYSPIALTATCIAHVRGGRRGLGMRRHYRNDAGERHFGHAVPETVRTAGASLLMLRQRLHSIGGRSSRFERKSQNQRAMRDAHSAIVSPLRAGLRLRGGMQILPTQDSRDSRWRDFEQAPLCA